MEIIKDKKARKLLKRLMNELGYSEYELLNGKKPRPDPFSLIGFFGNDENIKEKLEELKERVGLLYCHFKLEARTQSKRTYLTKKK